MYLEHTYKKVCFKVQGIYFFPNLYLPLRRGSPSILALWLEILYLLLIPALTLSSVLFLHLLAPDIGLLPFLTIPCSLDLMQIWYLRLSCWPIFLEYICSFSCLNYIPNALGNSAPQDPKAAPTFWASLLPVALPGFIWPLSRADQIPNHSDPHCCLSSLTP